MKNFKKRLVYMSMKSAFTLKIWIIPAIGTSLIKLTREFNTNDLNLLSINCQNKFSSLVGFQRKPIKWSVVSELVCPRKELKWNFDPLFRRQTVRGKQSTGTMSHYKESSWLRKYFKWKIDLPGRRQLSKENHSADQGPLMDIQLVRGV